jgi:peptide chain release factor 1
VYVQYGTQHGLEAEVVTSTEGHAVVKFVGQNVWELFRHEAGKHVVQRYPDNDRSGRRHTSLVSVAVLPLPPQQSEKRLPDNEVQVTTQRGHGKGGQHQNTTDSAVRATHMPTGLSVFINGRDQKANKKTALSILAAKVALSKDREAEERYGIERRSQLGDGGRGSKVRTYNFIDHYVKDHHTGKTTRRPERVMRGELELVI